MCGDDGITQSSTILVSYFGVSQKCWRLFVLFFVVSKSQNKVLDVRHAHKQHVIFAGQPQVTIRSLCISKILNVQGALDFDLCDVLVTGHVFGCDCAGCIFQ